MYEIRWHGRAGQGIITVSRLLAYAGLLEKKHIQSFPEFGPERIGAPMTGFTRISDAPIEVHSRINNPNVVAVLDSSLLKIVNVTDGLKEGGTLLINSDRSGKELTKELGISNVHCYTVDATKISLDVFGSGKAFNTAMLGALLKAVPVVSTESLTNAMKERFSAELIDKNLQVLEKGMTEVKVD
jgi:2-oxoacid:acceptor oxidoreductase gamma subunit (pyruvate/2-ketoisovalerate family)